MTIRRTLPSLVALTALAACGGATATAQTPGPDRPPAPEGSTAGVDVAAPQEVAVQEAPFIEVSGIGRVSVTPDVAQVSFAVVTSAQSADAAADRNAETMQRVLAALRDAGLPGLELGTFGYTLRPEYSFDEQDRSRRITGYTAANNVRATVSDVDAVGRVIDVAIRAGANQVSSLTFRSADPTGARREALTRAVQEARAEATTLATALGRTLGPPLEVRGGSQLPGPREYNESAVMLRAQADTPVEVADQEIVASVTIRFALGDPR